MTKCFNCGEENPNENMYCFKCGSPLNTNGNNQNLNQQNPNQQNPNQQNSNQQNSNQQNSNQQPPNQQYTNSNQNFNNQQNKTLTQKISDLSTPAKIGGIIVICCIGVLILAAFGSMSSDQGSLSSSSDSYTDYNSTSIFNSYSKDNCQDISYKELNKNPDKYYGENIKVSGKVMQIYEGSTNYLLMYVDGDYSQLFYVEYYNDTNIVEDDWITVYGVCAGSHSYETRIGTNTVPSMYGAELNKNS